MTESRRATLVNHQQDFEWAANQYRSTNKSIKELADDIGVTRSKLFDWFSQHNVTRDLQGQIHKQAMVLLAADAAPANGLMPSTPEDIISINATLQASLIRSHRSDIHRFRMLALGLLTELEGLTVYQDLFEDLGTLLRAEDDKGRDRKNDAYNTVISLSGRIDSFKKLGETLKILLTLERQAFGMRDDYEDDEIKRSRLAAITPVDAVTGSLDEVARKFQQVLIGLDNAKTPA